MALHMNRIAGLQNIFNRANLGESFGDETILVKHSRFLM
jgi:hypothetical protein